MCDPSVLPSLRLMMFQLYNTFISKDITLLLEESKKEKGETQGFITSFDQVTVIRDINLLNNIFGTERNQTY